MLGIGNLEAQKHFNQSTQCTQFAYSGQSINPLWSVDCVALRSSDFTQSSDWFAVKKDGSQTLSLTTLVSLVLVLPCQTLVCVEGTQAMMKRLCLRVRYVLS